MSIMTRLVDFYITQQTMLRYWLSRWLCEEHTAAVARAACADWIRYANSGVETPDGPYALLYQRAVEQATFYTDKPYGQQLAAPWHMMRVPTGAELCYWAQLYAVVYNALYVSRLDSVPYTMLVEAVAQYEIGHGSYQKIIQAAAEHGELITALRPVVDALEEPHFGSREGFNHSGVIWAREDKNGHAWRSKVLERLTGGGHGTFCEDHDNRCPHEANSVAYVEGDRNVRHAEPEPG